MLVGTHAHLTVGPGNKEVIRAIKPSLHSFAFRIRRGCCDVFPIAAGGKPKDMHLKLGQEAAEEIAAAGTVDSLTLWQARSVGSPHKVCKRPAFLLSVAADTTAPAPTVKTGGLDEVAPAPLPLMIANDGPRIKATNYWDTANAGEGKLLVSINAGHVRMLVPQCLEAELPDMVRGASRIEVSALETACWREGEFCADWEFIDGSDQPYVLQLSPGSFADSVPAACDAPAFTSVSLWVRRLGEPHRYAEFPLTWRTVRELPDFTLTS